MDNKNLLSYFKEPNKKNWSDDQVEEFWRKLREYMASDKVGCREFREYVFPKFEREFLIGSENGKSVFKRDCNFWKKGEERTLDYAVFDNAVFTNFAFFSGCKILGHAQFHNTLFQADAIFSDCEFMDQVVFTNTYFKKNANFSKAKFQGKILVFRSCHFQGESFFNEILLNCDCNFQSCDFNYFGFNFCEVNGLLDFDQCEFKSQVELVGNHINERLIVHSARFSNEQSVLIEDFNRDPNEKAPNLLFVNILFNRKFVLRRMDLSKTAFYQCDLVDASFKECFHQSKTLVAEEKFIEGKQYEALSDLYRQLKRNFENSKNWELADVAYRREMVMKKKYYHELARKKKFLTIYTLDNFLYFIYENVSGFNRSYTRPLALLIASSGVIFPLIYSFHEKSSFSDSFVKSLGATLPFFFKVETSIKYVGWGVHSTQTMVSTILIAFFLIAIRRRFKS